MRTPLRVLVLTLLATLLVGCGRGGQSSSYTVHTLEDTRGQLVKFQAAVDQTQAALGELATARDVKAVRDKLATAMDAMVTEADAVATHARALREHSRAHIARWEREMEEVNAAGAPDDVARRRSAVAANYAGIRQAADSARENYQSYADQLKDILTALTNDPTPAGVTMIGGRINKALADGQAFRRQLDEALARIDSVYAGQTATESSPARP